MPDLCWHNADMTDDGMFVNDMGKRENKHNF